MATVSSTTSGTTPGNLTAEMQIFYDRVFLERLIQQQKYNFLAIPKAIPKNSGKTVYFTRMTAFPGSAGATALTEGATPTGVNSTSTTVTATVAEYGAFEQISSLFQLTSIDAGLKEMVENFGQWAGESMDTVLGTVICAGSTEQCANGVQLSALASSDTMSVTELRKAVRTLKRNKAPLWESGNYRAVVSTQGSYELQSDTAAGNWINIGLYNSKENAEMLKKGMIGTLYGVDIVETNNEFTIASGTGSLSYTSYVGGKGAVAEVDIAGSKNAHIIYKKPGTNDTYNPLDMFATLGWKVDAYAARILNSNWIIRIVHQ